MVLSTWKNDINNRYKMIQAQLKNSQQNAMYKHIEKAIRQHDIEGNYDISYKLNEWLDTHYNISNMYIQLQELHKERIDWLKAYTNNNSIQNNEYYRQLAYKCIHENIYHEDISKLIKEVAI